MKHNSYRKHTWMNIGARDWKREYQDIQTSLKNGPVTTIKPAMRCDICNQSFQPSLTLQHTRRTNHNSWSLIEQLPT